MIFKHLKKITFLLLLLSSVNVMSQSKSVWLYQADYYFSKYDYPSSLRLYKMVMDDSLGLSTQIIPYEAMLSNQKLKSKKDTSAKVSTEDYVHHQIALCYKYSYDYNNAKVHFKKSAENGSYPDDYYYYANSLMNLGFYEEALAAYEEFIVMEGTSDQAIEMALQDMTGCVFALKVSENEELIDVTLADTAVFNKGTSSFGVTYWGKDKSRLVFSSARKGGVLVDPEKQDSEYLLDLYWTEKEEGKWKTAKNFGRPLNSSKHEASGMFNHGNAIFFTKWSDDTKLDKQIYVAREFDLRFFESQKMDSMVNVPGYQSINPFVSEDGQWLYFSSDRPGGIGGLDIWRIKIDEAGKPLEVAENLGKPVNSEFDLEIIAKETIYDKMFKVIKENLVPRTNSLTKLDYLFNELPYLNNNEDKPSSTVFASLLINQVLTATLLAAVNDNKNKESIYEKYLSYASKFAEGDYSSIDVMRGIIKANSIC